MHAHALTSAHTFPFMHTHITYLLFMYNASGAVVSRISSGCPLNTT